MSIQRIACCLTHVPASRSSTFIWNLNVFGPRFFLGLSMLRAYKQTKRTIGKWQTDYSRNVTHPRMSHRDGVLPMATDNAAQKRICIRMSRLVFVFFPPTPRNTTSEQIRQDRDERIGMFDIWFMTPVFCVQERNVLILGWLVVSKFPSSSNLGSGLLLNFQKSSSSCASNLWTV